MLETDSQNLITNNSRNDTSSHDNTNTLTNNIISSTNKRSNLIRKTKREATRKKSKQTKSISYDNNNDDSNPSPNQNAISQNDINEDDDDDEASDFDIFDTDGNGANNNVTELLVGADHEYKTIQSAINVAKGKTIIKIDKGIYRETIQIKSKKDIELTSLDPKEPAIILSENSPCISIYCLEVPDVIKIVNLKFIHRGIRDDLATGGGDILTSDFFAWHNVDMNNKENLFIYKNAKEIDKLEINYTLDVKIIENIFEDNHGNFSAISILKGTVFIMSCQISLGFLTTETRNVLPAVYVENSNAIIENTMIKGNKDYLTIGIFSHNAQMKINECKILRHRCGGIVSVVDERNTVNITKCHFLGNAGCGISIMSMAGLAALKEKSAGVKNALEINIEQNLIELNMGVGLILKKCFNASVIGNKFNSNLLNGAVLTDCDGFVMMNEFLKNKGSGLIVEAVEETNGCKIFKNIIIENYKNGIDIRGENNTALISQNAQICHNYLNGIYVHDQSHPQIKNNNLYNNNHHGILIESNSSADVFSNKIYGNVRTNISFGGKLSERTKICENEISQARNEGIYVIEANGGKISHNKIFDNNEGIVLIKCEGTEINNNEIYNNARAGVLLSDMSTPNFINNQLYENYFIGILFRDASKGKIEGNQMRQNVIQFYLSKNCLKMKKSILDNNNVEGRYDCADYCSIF